MYGRKRAPAECLFLNIKKYCFHDCLHAGKTRRTASLSAIKACEKICVRRGNPLEKDIHEKSFAFGKIFFREVKRSQKRLTAGVNPPLRFSVIDYSK